MKALLISILAAALPALALAQQANPAETRLREALRDATAKLQAAQNEVASLQSSNTGLLAERDTAAARASELEKQIGVLKAGSEKAMKEIKTRATAQAEELEKTKAALKELQQKFEALTDTERKLRAEAAELTVRASSLEGRLTDRESKNIRLYLLANEVLKRYEDHSLGKALLAKEPFIGRMRVKLENLVQEYRDKIDASLVKS
ncbi:phage major capsid protein [Nibricoccus sp. IMCC34717]|uniref:phage major capsid protein n=1 Tax=Nibricoccus sp. IMCC34717 TaxID=3034021 RepID=UPI00384FB712